MGDPAELKLGPCNIFYKSDNLGFTMDNSVAIKGELTTLSIIPDQVGSAVKEYVTGQNVSVECSIGETGRLQLQKLVLGAEATGVDTAIAFCSAVGADLLALAGELLIVPLDSSETDAYRFPKAAVKTNMELLFSKEAVRTLPVTFTIFPDKTEHTHTVYDSGAFFVIEDTSLHVLP